MKHSIILFLLCTSLSFSARGSITLEQCVEQSIANYPLIQKYGLIAATRDIDLSEINKTWLPRIGVYGQLTVQNTVPSFPESLSNVIANMGQEIKGLGKTQYKIGVDISQSIWDGGASAARREVARSENAVQKAALDVELYQIRQRVENLYFAILLTEEQISQNTVTHQLLCNNLERLRSMLQNGTAMQTDLDMVEAQALVLNQNITQARSAVKGYLATMTLFTGIDIEGEKLAMPSAEFPLYTEPNRPELELYSRRQEANNAANRLADTALMPKIGLFAQGYYGYPGFDYFSSMLNRDLSINLLAGIKISWSIDSFYTKKNTSRKTALSNDNIASDRETFLFNTKIQAATQTEAINGLREIIQDDARIVNLRTNVRKAAESQLTNGVIDATTLLTKISDESIAILSAKFHEIQLLQEIYKLKYTLDR